MERESAEVRELSSTYGLFECSDVYKLAEQASFHSEVFDKLNDNALKKRSFSATEKRKRKKDAEKRIDACGDACEYLEMWEWDEQRSV